MFSAYDQENLATTHQRTAASKPLNLATSTQQPRTPAAHLKTPFRARNDENKPLPTAKGKPAQDVFVTPAPRTNRAPLGAKTANAKAQPFQTPAPGQKAPKTDQTIKKQSAARRSAKKKIYVEPERHLQTAETETVTEEQDNEPDSGYAPPPIIPLPDPPLDFSGIDPTYPMLRPENFNRGVGDIYFQSPKDENGSSISLKKQKEADKKSLEDDLAGITQFPGPIHRPHRKASTKESQINTIKASSASAALSQQHPELPRQAGHRSLPSAVNRETASSKQKRKPFAVSRDNTDTLSSIPSKPLPVSHSTIGFPKAKKAPSIIPQSQQAHTRTERNVFKPSKEVSEVDRSNISPRKFVQLYGEPEAESDMWIRLMELEIKDRRRDDEEQQDMSIFEMDNDGDLDAKLGLGDVDEDFELSLDDL